MRKTDESSSKLLRMAPAATWLLFIANLLILGINQGFELIFNLALTNCSFG